MRAPSLKPLLLALPTLLLAGLIFAGCGGGGGGTATTGNNNGGGNNGGGGITISISPQAPRTVPGGQIFFQATVIGGGGVTWADDYGTITAQGSTTAKYTAPQQNLLDVVTATATNDATVSKSVVVGVVDATHIVVGGFVYQTASTTPEPGIVVQLFDSTGKQVASATSAADGSWSTVTPASAVSFSLQPASLINMQANAIFQYNNLGYTALSATCHAPLPHLSIGQAVVLPGGPIYVFPDATVPPPPDGCTQ